MRVRMARVRDDDFKLPHGNRLPEDTPNLWAFCRWMAWTMDQDWDDFCEHVLCITARTVYRSLQLRLATKFFRGTLRKLVDQHYGLDVADAELADASYYSLEDSPTCWVKLKKRARASYLEHRAPKEEPVELEGDVDV